MRGLVHSLLASTLLLCGADLASARSVGVAAAVNQQARGTPPGAAVRTLAIGENVIFNERIETNPIGLLQILLADGTAFTVGPNSVLTIDRFVFDPDKGTAEVSATLTKGVFRFIGGRTSKTPGGVKLDSPVGVIGIRGAVVDMAFEGPAKGRVSMVFGKEVTLTAANGRVSRLYQPGYSIEVSPNGSGESVQIVRTPPDAANLIQQALSGAPGTRGGAPRSPSDTIVATSNVGAENSARSPATNTVPIPEPRPQTAARGEVQTAIQNAGTDVVRDEAIEVVDAGPAPAPGPGGTPGGNPGGTPGGEPEVPDLPGELPDTPFTDWPQSPELANIATYGQLAPLAGVNATYAGTAYGAVFDPRVPDDVTTYREANGSFLMNFDFGSREGNLAVTGIEGRNFGGALAAPGGDGLDDVPAVFSGDLNQTNGDATGAVAGYFTNTNGVASGVYAGFNAQNPASDWAVSGVLSGDRR